MTKDAWRLLLCSPCPKSPCRKSVSSAKEKSPASPRHSRCPSHGASHEWRHLGCSHRRWAPSWTQPRKGCPLMEQNCLARPRRPTRQWEGIVLNYQALSLCSNKWTQLKVLMSHLVFQNFKIFKNSSKTRQAHHLLLYLNSKKHHSVQTAVGAG